MGKTPTTYDGKKPTGYGKDRLEESVPGFDKRDGDAVITAEGVGDVKFGGYNNNAWIVFGRD